MNRNMSEKRVTDIFRLIWPLIVIYIYLKRKPHLKYVPLLILLHTLNSFMAMLNTVCFIIRGDYSHAALFKMYCVGFRAFKSPPI